MATRLFKSIAYSGMLLLSGPVLAENLVDIYELARQNDATYLSAVAEFDAAREASPQAWAAVLPQINLSGTHSEIEQETTPLGSTTTTEDYETDRYSLTLTQTIYRQAQFDRISQSSAEVAAARARFDNAGHELILRVAQQYFNVLGAQDSLVFARAEKEAIEQQLVQARERFRVGLTAITDVHEAQARYDQAVASEINADNQYAISLEALRVLTNQQPQALAVLADDAPMATPEPADVNTWITNALSNNLLLLAADKNMQAARHARGVARSGHFPTLDLQAERSDYETTGGSLGALQQDSTSISLVLNVPIFSGGATNSAAKQAAANYERARQQHEFTRRNTESLARNTYLTVLSNISRVKALKQALRSTQTALEATQAGYEVGTRTAVDVLDAQRELFRAQRDYARARYDYYLETLRLKQAVGTLSVADLQQINTWLK